MTWPAKTSLAALLLAGAFCGLAIAVRVFLPPSRMIGSSQLTALSAEHAQLASFSDAAARDSDARLEEFRRLSWTVQSFARWQKAHVAPGWLVEDLGSSDLRHVQSRRYAFQRPNATDAEWPEITALLRELESAPFVSVQSAAFAVEPTYAGSRHFSQCLLVAVFYFAGDSAQSPTPR